MDDNANLRNSGPLLKSNTILEKGLARFREIGLRFDAWKHTGDLSGKKIAGNSTQSNCMI